MLKAEREKRFDWMKEDLYYLISTILLFLFIVISFINYIAINLANNPFYFQYLILFLAIYFFIKAPKTEEVTTWTCQKCKTKLLRSQIKFGLCPVCSVKVKGFQGLKGSY